MDDLVIPEHIAPRPPRLLNEDARQTDGFRALVVEFGEDASTARLHEIIEHGLGKLAIERGIHHHVRTSRSSAAAQRNDQNKDHQQRLA